ncbi:MAG: hypothetical protein BGO11_02160 [Solirubrobacterales bacterium 70-9]|nr:MAG: hypothetical protein BGO11_02160 [Solirubrobacterales bacterium 70-9]
MIGVRVFLITSLVASLSLGAFFAGPVGAAGSEAGAVECPDGATLGYPANPRGAIPAAKAYSFGEKGRVTVVGRGIGSTYAAAVRRACGQTVLKDSAYVQVHPIGVRCSACDAHLYLVRPKGAAWKVWISY